uniref:Ribosomal protein L3 n=1 Tax=Strombidium rassoulzadegani TaxID=1082188 RepID=A0A7S3CMH6_9SPIT|mmetsp:Transcript_17503/g.29479  ORF Transcript_17503/g.29479 Transcript_17503/m.29479 type:complete len:397 (+) Transcript_17503:52-1242(+)|eukprot:CAMPEP_0168607628 /NCGR_PEP_ID=MMETSP0449_2-20121227/160_1 /TAXON_ID=1082188 /ORGANISM="Strombidium rassoulzadegani, Strain ras09" /LENGTH=396 /DNA_ID=CAMNT_0008647489 /DNA_START=33 /DNA_END=1223 /DNA_ORIENTATION=-
MSHRKFEHPRQGHLGYLPKRRTKHTKGKIRSFPRDDKTKPVHITGFIGYKAGMTHIVRTMNKREGKKTVKKDVSEAVSIIECPPIKVIGVVGYIETPRGLRTLSTAWAQNLPEGVIRRFYKNYYCSKKKAFSKYALKYKEDPKSNKHVNRDLNRIKKFCSVVRVIVASQIEKCKFRQRKAHVMELQVNGGSVAQKVDFCVEKFEKEISVGEVFSNNEMIDTISITQGKGTQGVIKRFGVSRLPRKTHRGLRKVACIGAWHPSAVKWTVARAGNLGYHHRTQINQKVYRVGAGAIRGTTNNGSTEQDPHVKNITPIGGFPHYGIVNEDFLMIKGGVMGPKKRCITLRKTLIPQTSSFATHELDIKFIDTSSKMGHGKFQTLEEKDKFMGPLASKQRE